MKVYGYDLEVFRNCLTCAIVDIEDFVIKCDGIELLSYAEQLKIYDSVNQFVFVTYGNKNDIPKMLSFLNRNQYVVGFNNSKYDDTIIKFIMMKLYNYKSVASVTKAIYNFSQKLINTQNDYSTYDWELAKIKQFNVKFRSIDLMSAFGLTKIFKSLKQTGINIKWHNILEYSMPAPREEELALYEPYEDPYTLEVWHRYVMPYHLKDICDYNLNDTLSTSEIFRKKLKDIVLRINISSKYNVNVISSSESDIADNMFAKFYCDKSGLTLEQYKAGGTMRDSINVGECIPNTIKFTTTELQKLYNKLKDLVIVETKGELEFNIDFDCTKYKFATGGLHSKDTPGILKSTEEYEYIDADANAYYPWNVIHHKIHPEHLDCDTFLNTVGGIVQDRTDAKPSGIHPDPTTDKTLKIVINSGIFGKMGFIVRTADNVFMSPVYDPKALVSVTVSGQLYLLMLIEMLAAGGFHCVSANTDGIICKVPITRKPEYYTICHQWENYTKFVLEYTYYAMYIRRDINNYFAVKTSNVDIKAIRNDEVSRNKYLSKYVKFKGDFNANLHLEDLRKGFNRPIVAKAIGNYFIFDIPVMDTIKKSTDIYDFCATTNIGRRYSLISKKIVKGKLIVTINQRNSRWYVSTNGSYLYKYDKVDNSKVGIFTGFKTTIMNRYIEYPSMTDYYIDYAYYYAEAMVVINRILSGSVKGAKRGKKPGNNAKKKLNPAAKSLGQVGTLF